ncbi:citrate/2-methylcitrate synthase, partial [Collinsella aerofaciens]
MAYDAKKIYYRFDDHLSRLVLDYEASRQISSESESLYHGLPTDPYDEGLFEEHNVKRGLRNADGSGVVAGLTRISDVHGYNKVDGKVVPDQGKLTLRGYSIEDLVNNAQAENRYGYEEVAYLLITGSLPNKEELDGFCERLGAFRHLSDEYVKEFPMTTVSSSIMNVLQRAVLLLYAFDAEPDV